MTQTADPYQLRREAWITRVRALADQIKGWSQSQGWSVEGELKTVHEDLLGEYSISALRITTPIGTLHFNPIALHVAGADGRIDLEAFPTLSRVKLLGANGGWKVMTDSNVPLREPWNEKTFVQLASDLMS